MRRDNPPGWRRRLEGNAASRLVQALALLCAPGVPVSDQLTATTVNCGHRRRNCSFTQVRPCAHFVNGAVGPCQPLCRGQPPRQGARTGPWGADAGLSRKPASSELDEGWALDTRTTFHTPESAVRHSGWLLKAYGGGPHRQWRRRYVYVLADRLCYTPDPGANGAPSPVRYLPLDRIPVRALPRGYGPKLGVTVVEDRQVRRHHLPNFQLTCTGNQALISML